MKVKAILFASVLLAGCQATQNTGSQPQSQQHTAYGQTIYGQSIYGQTPDDNRLNNSVIPAEDENLWGFIQAQLTLPIPDNARVREQRAFYLGKKNYLHAVLVRADPYLYWIADQVQKRQMPMELALLPIVESAFNPFAKSPAKAAGIWQIIPSTGRNYGLKQTRGYDARYDLAESTTAALDILQKLNGMFDGDWLLTIAAYNSGEGRVLKAIKENKAKGKPTDYWSLNLPRETKLYVPRLLALSDIFKHSQRYGLILPKTDENRALVKVPLNAPVDIEQLSQNTGIDAKKLKAFNAGVKGKVYGLAGPQYVMVPRKHAGQLEQALTNGDFAPVSAALIARDRALASAPQHSQTYKVRSGDSLSTIARRLGVSVKNLQSWNKLHGHIIKAGQTLAIRAPARPSPQQIAKNTPKSTKHLVANSITYKVRKGDSLYSIARRHGVKIEDLKRWNASTDNLQPGDQLTLYIKNPKPTPDS